MGKIRYTKGDVVGDYGIFYLHESKPYIRPNGMKERCAIFKCANCHSEFETQIQSVRYNHTTSCGCKREGHRLYGHQLYDVWNSMIQRCYSKNNVAYERYGAKGIKVYGEWQNNPQTFFDHIISLPHYNENGYSLDRSDPNGDYDPGNVQWATKHEQASNQRRARNNTSGYVGVSFKKKIDKWVAYITIRKKTIYLKYHYTPKEAAIARDWYIIDNKLWEYPLQVLNHEDFLTL